MNAEQNEPGVATPAGAAAAWSPDQLVDALNVLDVPFLAGGTGAPVPPQLGPAVLLAGLAASDEARLRLAVIPLLLRRPECAAHADAALACMPAAAQLGFRCFYTAAVFLQQQYRARLDALFGPLPAVPDRYSQKLGIDAGATPAAALSALAERQVELSGRHLNWRVTYQRGAETFLVVAETHRRWAHLTPT